MRLLSRVSGSYWIGLGILGALAAAVGLSAQDDKPNFTTQTNLVTLHVSVLDKNGKLVTDIPRSAFKVKENDVEQPIQLFQREDVPVSMGILIDNSGSMSGKIQKVAAAARALVKGSNP